MSEDYAELIKTLRSGFIQLREVPAERLAAADAIEALLVRIAAARAALGDTK